MATSPTFEDRYRALNASQKQAVDAIEGPVMVIAGPGTGKTTILTLRIANILLKTDTAPENILALTFTESGVYAMRKKLVALIGNAGYRVRIHTFHGFCNEVIQRYPEYFPRIIGGTSIQETERIAIVESAITKGSATLLKPFGDPLYYVSHTLRTIQELKREGVSVEKLRAFLGHESEDLETNETYYNKKTGSLKTAYISLEKKIARTKEFCDVYESYQQALVEQKKYDFEDMILEAVTALEEHSDLLQILQEEHQYLLADEHQDTNAAQNRILELLASFHESPNIFIVGDEKQAIYRFQGASLENFLYFKGKYNDALLINLDTNYRSTQSILDASHAVIEHNTVEDPTLRIPLIAGASTSTQPVSVYGFSHEQYEYQFLIADIQKKIEAGIDPNDIAVLYRNNAEVASLLAYFEQSSIPFTIHADRNVLKELDAVRLITLLRSINTPLDDVLIAKVLHMDFVHVYPVDVHKVLRYAAEKKIPIIDVVLNQKIITQELQLAYPEQWTMFGTSFAEWMRLVRDTTPMVFIEQLLRSSGLLAHILSHDASYERLAVIDSLFTELQKVPASKPYATIEDVLEHVQLLETYSVRVPMRSTTTQQGVSLMTAHRSKGLEFGYVYIVGVTDKRWGGKQDRSYFRLPIDQLSDTVRDADERRLFYVALTRAKYQVSITYAEKMKDGATALPSQFINELKQELVSYEDAARIEETLGGLHGAYPETLQATAKSAHDATYLQQLFLSQPFSVTALNNYLTCPWQYFFMNLIRLPKTYSKHQQYGTAVHEALRQFFDAYATGEEVPVDTLVAYFRESLREHVAADDVYEELLEKGRVGLSTYYETYNGTWLQTLRTEFNVRGVDLQCADATLTLTGKLDKVEFISEHRVSVVDYKTGKPKSRNAIMGQTQSENGDYFRQLVFYKVLLDRFDEGKYQMETGSIDFIEPENGACRREVFEITDADTTALLEVINTVASEIYNLSFWNRRCDNKDCEHCALRDVMPE
jgi:DNA helicase II / ATP-dependent DNA helicase PcrA